MPKRFGRNQKSQLKSEIKTLQGVISTYDELIQRQRAQIQSYKNDVDNAVRVLGLYSVALPPRVMSIPGDPRDDIYMMKRSNFIDGEMHQKQRLHVLLTQVRKNDITTGIHCSVKFAGEEARYAISEESLYHMDEAFLIEHISKSMAEYLAVQLKKVYPTKGRS